MDKTIPCCLHLRFCDASFKGGNSGSERWVQLRSNGAIKLNTGCVAAEGVVRDHNGNWIVGFNHYLGNYSVF